MTLDPEAVGRAARLLAQRRRSGEAGARLPDDCRPRDLESALAVQEAVTREMNAQVAGWKCLQPTPDRLVVAPLYTRDVHKASPVSIWAPESVARIEPELGFVLGRDLAHRETPWTESEVDGALAHTYLVLELIGGRYTDPASADFPELLADGLFNQGVFLGPEVDPQMAAEASTLDVSLTCRSAAPEQYNGRHPNGRPRAPIYWLAEFLRGRGMGLRAGDLVITGSYAGVLSAPLEEPVRIQFGDLGELGVAFKAHMTG